MIKKRIILTAVFFVLVVTALAVNAFAVGNTSVSVKVKTLTSEMYVTTTISQVFQYSQPSAGGVIVSGLKNFGSYSVDSIREIRIPTVVTELNLTGNYEKITSLIIEDYCSVKVTSLKGLTGLKTLKVGYGNTTFSSGSMPTGLTSLEIGGVNGKTATYKFSTSSFSGVSALETIIFDPKNTYEFDQYAFKGVGITELNLVDGAIFKFNNSGVFSNCANLKTVYGGDGVTALGASTFENCYALETVVFTGLTNMSDSTFAISTAGAEKAKLKVYIHTAKACSLGANSFRNRNNLGVICCAIAPGTTSFTSCKYELLYGVQHAHEPLKIEPTCTQEGANTYTTDCPCGKVRNAVYKRYQSGVSGFVLVEMFTTSIPRAPHEYGDVHSLEYKDGINKAGTIEYACTACGEREGVDKPVKPVFDFPGYSVFEGGNAAMVVGIRFNPEALAQYEEVMGVTIRYGIVLAGKSVLNGQNPFKSNGAVYSDKVYVYDMKAKGHFDSTLKLSGIGSANYDTEFVFSAYLRIGNEIVYVDNGGVSKNATAVTYNSLKS